MRNLTLTLDQIIPDILHASEGRAKEANPDLNPNLYCMRVRDGPRMIQSIKEKEALTLTLTLTLTLKEDPVY